MAMFNCIECDNPDTVCVTDGGAPICADHPEQFWTGCNHNHETTKG